MKLFSEVMIYSLIFPSLTRHLQKIRATDFQRQILPTHRSIDPYNVLKILATKCLRLVILNCQETQFFSDLM